MADGLPGIIFNYNINRYNGFLQVKSFLNFLIYLLQDSCARSDICPMGNNDEIIICAP